MEALEMSGPSSDQPEKDVLNECSTSRWKAINCSSFLLPFMHRHLAGYFYSHIVLCRLVAAASCKVYVTAHHTIGKCMAIFCGDIGPQSIVLLHGDNHATCKAQ
jgi:hypothetical protein